MKSSLFILLFFIPILSIDAQLLEDPFASVNKEIEVEEMEKIQPENPHTYPSLDIFIEGQNNLNYRIKKIYPLEILKLEEQSRFIYVLDARSEEEFVVSHLKHARRVGFRDFSIERVWMFDRDVPVILYATLDNRSEKVATYLKMLGFTYVRVLDGIIHWANEGYELVDRKGQITKIVHVHKRGNSLLLKKGKAKAIF